MPAPGTERLHEHASSSHAGLASWLAGVLNNTQTNGAMHPIAMQWYERDLGCFVPLGTYGFPVLVLASHQRIPALIP